MKFTYTKLPSTHPVTDKQIDTCRPYIPIDIAHNHQWASKLFGIEYINALVDSGADNNLTPIELADALGIPWQSLQAKETYGIEGNGIRTYYTPITLLIGGDVYSTFMGFMPNLSTVLLGGNGFFNRFKVKFDYPKSFEITKRNG